jgi:hypothetical protein
MEIEDSYVIRISRRSSPDALIGARRDAARLSGVVESPTTGQRLAFADIEELWALLVHTGNPAPGSE